METRFGRLLWRLHSVGMAATADAVVDCLDSQGQVLAQSVLVQVDNSIERVNEDSGAIDRVRVMSVLHSALPRFDRAGAFRDQAGKTWYFDGIREDDGHLLSLYVVP